MYIYFSIYIIFSVLYFLYHYIKNFLGFLFDLPPIYFNTRNESKNSILNFDQQFIRCLKVVSRGQGKNVFLMISY